MEELILKIVQVQRMIAHNIPSLVVGILSSRIEEFQVDVSDDPSLVLVQDQTSILMLTVRMQAGLDLGFA
jgi:hypothetical protein